MSSLRISASSSKSSLGLNSSKDNDYDECDLQQSIIERLQTSERLRSSLSGKDDNESNIMAVDITKVAPVERHLFVEKLVKHIQHDNGFAKLAHLMGNEARISIIDGVSGIIKPGRNPTNLSICTRMTLLLGPPGCGMTTFLKVLSGILHRALKVTGELSYNGYKLDEFIPQKTLAYVSQDDLHIAEMTVRATWTSLHNAKALAAEKIMMEVSRREMEAGIFPDPDVDTYVKAVALKGQKRPLQTDYNLKILRLDSCADSLVGDAMRRGISGGQKK
ncbi:hypothetical protein CRG98_026540 [Punica granatum]|uniref:ABC transporter domain-containing protein n=1 Tax=Punica granatum TaxID=22663 RepID=A0A2I0JA04_PUNGR|nr:hypothetical protein CRG98_026540 [Punica granatum]